MLSFSSRSCRFLSSFSRAGLRSFTGLFTTGLGLRAGGEVFTGGGGLLTPGLGNVAGGLFGVVGVQGGVECEAKEGERVVCLPSSRGDGVVCRPEDKMGADLRPEMPALSGGDVGACRTPKLGEGVMCRPSTTGETWRRVKNGEVGLYCPELADDPDPGEVAIVMYFLLPTNISLIL